jgi:hypothetical protein
MRAELKSWFSRTVDLDTYAPADREEYSFDLTLMVGPEGADASEAFYARVCSPGWLVANSGPDSVRVGERLIIAPEYNVARIIAAIAAFCSRCSGDTWAEVAVKVSRAGAWEYEDEP